MIESHCSEDGPVPELLNMKTKLERSIQDLSNIKEDIKRSISIIKDQKVSYRKKKTDEYHKLYKTKISLVDANKRAEAYESYISSVNTIMTDMANSIRDANRISKFEESIFKVNSSHESAINFFSEDNLHMELMKRSNSVREKRVEFTTVEHEFNEMTRKIEEQKREAERARLAEVERIRKEEERLKRLEEEKILSELKNQRECRPTTTIKELNQSFLVKLAANSCSATSVSSFNTEQLPTMENTTTGESPSNIRNMSKKSDSLPDISFSQYLRWDS